MIARRRHPVSVAVALAAGGLLLAPLAAILWRAEGVAALLPSDVAALRFTLWQAFLSALASVLLAIPVARALARRRFPGRRALITLLGAPFLLPVIVAVMGLLALFGRNGWLNAVLGWAGIEPVSVYGLQGVVLAHVFFNLPLATRMILQGWEAIPAERFRLVAALDLPPWRVRRLLEYPMLRATLPAAFAVIFAICLSSFAVALMLGGGPRASTVELAIYQAFRFDFDLGRAALLALIQLALVGTAGLVATMLARGDGFGIGLDRAIARWDAPGGLAPRLADGAVIVGAAAFLLLPMALILFDGFGALPRLPASVWRAAGISVPVALGSAAICLALALPLSLGRSFPREAVGAAGLALSPLVLGTGAFILVNPVFDPARLALVITSLVNALMALPFALRVLTPEITAAEAGMGRLADSLGLTGWARLRIAILPRARRGLGFAAGLAAALSMGDLGVILLFADPDLATLPLQMYRLMGAYRTELAAGAGVLLLGLSFGLFWVFDRWGRAGAET